MQDLLVWTFCGAVDSWPRFCSCASYRKGYTLYGMTWQVEFYVDELGRAPVEEFLMALPTNHRAKALALIKMLEEEGPSLPFPYSSQVKGKLRELRTQQGKDKLRILYFGDAKRVFILLHGIVKRSAKPPEEDIRIAEGRMEFHSRRFEGRKQ